jgi:hypothetical protein
MISIVQNCTCGAHLALDSEDEEYSGPIWMLTFRFANAHVRCGYMTSGLSPDSPDIESKEVVLGPRKRDNIKEF